MVVLGGAGARCNHPLVKSIGCGCKVWLRLLRVVRMHHMMVMMVTVMMVDDGCGCICVLCWLWLLLRLVFLDVSLTIWLPTTRSGLVSSVFYRAPRSCSRTDETSAEATGRSYPQAAHLSSPFLMLAAHDRHLKCVICMRAIASPRCRSANAPRPGLETPLARTRASCCPFHDACSTSPNCCSEKSYGACPDGATTPTASDEMPPRIPAATLLGSIAETTVTVAEDAPAAN